MKTAGVILTVIGSLFLVGTFASAFTTYDLGDSHDLSKFTGSLGVSVILLAAGLILQKRGNTSNDA
jgi:hypothetical protein